MTTPTGMTRRPKQDPLEKALAEYAEKGAHTYADRRLLDITESVERLRFLVQLMAALVLLSVLFGLLGMIAASS